MLITHIKICEIIIPYIEKKREYYTKIYHYVMIITEK